MSGNREPTLADIMAAVTGLRGELTNLRVAVMARIDRLQDDLSAQREDSSVLLDLMVSNQRIAERGLSEARLSMDLGSRTTTTMATLSRQIRHLQDEVRGLRDRA